MADGTQMSGQPDNGVPAQPNDGGPQPPNAPVQPGTGNPINDPSTSPSAPVNHPAPDAEASALAEMNDPSPDNFLANFLAGEGISPAAPVAPTPTGAQAPTSPPTGQQPQVQPPVNGQPPTNGVPASGQQGVDPSLLQRLMQGPQAAAPPVMPGMPPQPTAWQPPVQPQQAPQGQQPGQQPVDPNAAPVLFNEALQLPPELVAALNHDDPQVRATAIGAAMAAAANTTIARYHKYVNETVLPRYSQTQQQQFEQAQFRQTVERDLYGNYPHLRYASPDLISRAAQVVVQDELSRNPAAANGAIPPAVWHKIGQLASAGLQQMVGGQVPTFQQPQAPPQPQFQPQPPQQFQQPPMQPAYYPQPQMLWNGQQWVPQGPQPMYAPQPTQQPPYVAGQSAGPFGMPAPTGPTPESEFAAFMNNGGFNG